MSTAEPALTQPTNPTHKATMTPTDLDTAQARIINAPKITRAIAQPLLDEVRRLGAERDALLARLDAKRKPATVAVEAATLTSQE